MTHGTTVRFNNDIGHHSSEIASQLPAIASYPSGPQSKKTKKTMMQRHQESYQSNHEGHALMRHISMAPESSPHEHRDPQSQLAWLNKWIRHRKHYEIFGICGSILGLIVLLLRLASESSVVVPIQQAHEHILDIGGGLSIWYRIWGNLESGIPVLFVHGGPGNCIADYGFGNARFFDQHEFFVVEVDQRGTGKSHPSVRDDCRNLQYYQNITIGQMSDDFELVRKDLNIDKWLVFGGSWGTTLSIDYAERYPEPVLGLILRGIWLNTRPEFDTVFTRSAYLGNEEQLAKFNTWFELAAQEATNSGETELDPDDGERFFRLYGRLIQQCDKHAMWRWHSWENNQMEEDPKQLLDPFTIDPNILPEAMSISFFENRLFLDGTYDNPSKLLERVHKLKDIHIWICQGLGDKVCPTKFGALKLTDALANAGITTRAQFLDAGHEDTNPLVAQCLEDSVGDFLAKYTPS